MPHDPRQRAASLARAMDEARFGPSRTLDLRSQLPTVAQAVARAESWLRERQMARAGEVLVITGRGNSSDGGVSPVRTAVGRLLTQLRRRGVVLSIQEHTPGSYAVRLAPVAALLDAARRKRELEPRPRRDPAALGGLEPETRALLRTLAERSLQLLGGGQLEGRFVSDEMVRQFAVLAPGIPDGPERDVRFRNAIQVALMELE